MNISELENKTRDELMELAKQQEIEGYKGLKKSDLIQRLIQGHTVQQGNIYLSGILDIMDGDVIKASGDDGYFGGGVVAGG